MFSVSIFRRLLAGAVLLGLVAPGAFLSGARAQDAARGIIEGRVLNATNGDYLNNARVSIEGTDAETLTDRAGQFRLTGVPSGEVKLKVNYSGLASAVKTVVV